MSRNGSGTYSRVPGSAYTNGTTADGTELDAEFNDIATEITGSIAKNGETTPTANLPMGTYRHTGAGAAAARTDYARAGESQDSTYQWLTSVSGTNTVTATGAISVAAYATGQTFRFATAGANTDAVTININSIGAKAITKNGTTALVSGDLVSGAVYEITYDGTQFQLQSNATLDAELVALAGLTSAANKIPMFSGSGTATVIDFLDDDTFAADSATAVPSQQSVKTYVNTLGIPQNSKSATYTTVLSDANKHLLHPSADTTARTFTIDSNANVAYPVGTAITFVNQASAGVLTIAITADTMRLAGAGTTGSRTLAANGIATALKLTTTEWIISGTGLS